jgi:hypothetical protein
MPRRKRHCLATKRLNGIYTWYGMMVLLIEHLLNYIIWVTQSFKMIWWHTLKRLQTRES